MGLMSWFKSLFAEKPAVTITFPTYDGPTSNTVMTHHGPTSNIALTIPDGTYVPVKKERKPRAKPVKPTEETCAKKPKGKKEPKAPKEAKVRKPRAKKAVANAVVPVDIIEEVTIEEIGENYTKMTDIVVADETKSPKKGE